tara:strand:- start:264 stop:1364 length:1101 start_codon:yes stop_codon:yes gene_type:complete
MLGMSEEGRHVKDESSSSSSSFFCQICYEDKDGKLVADLSSRSDIHGIQTIGSAEEKGVQGILLDDQGLKGVYSDTGAKGVAGSNGAAQDVCHVLSKCQHKFCVSCLLRFFKSEIERGRTVFPCCFYHEKTDENGKEEEEAGSCGVNASEEEVRALLLCYSSQEVYGSSLVKKLDRTIFKEKHKPHARECHKCNHMQRAELLHHKDKVGSATATDVQSGAWMYNAESNNVVQCENQECGALYCYFHANAHLCELPDSEDTVNTVNGENDHDHAAKSSKSCYQYQCSVDEEQEQSAAYISTITKACPNPRCTAIVSKLDGCNHMKCPECDTHFCWLCLEILSSDILPAHYQWWNYNNGGRCTNMQVS